MSISVLIRPNCSLSTSSNKSDVHPVFVFYSLLFYAGLNFKVHWQEPLGSGTKGEKISHDGQDRRGFYTCLCVVIESLPLDSSHIHFVLCSSAFLPAAFIFSFVFCPHNHCLCCLAPHLTSDNLFSQLSLPSTLIHSPFFKVIFFDKHLDLYWYATQKATTSRLDTDRQIRGVSGCVGVWFAGCHFFEFTHGLQSSPSLQP